MFGFLHWLANTPNGFVLAMMGAVLFGAAVYETPTVIAWSMGCKRLWLVAILNIFLGWTIIAWIVLLVWSLICGDGGSFDKGANG